MPGDLEAGPHGREGGGRAQEMLGRVGRPLEQGAGRLRTTTPTGDPHQQEWQVTVLRCRDAASLKLSIPTSPMGKSQTMSDLPGQSRHLEEQGGRAKHKAKLVSRVRCCTLGWRSDFSVHTDTWGQCATLPRPATTRANASGNSSSMKQGS